MSCAQLSSAMTEAGQAICTVGRCEALSSAQQVATWEGYCPPPQLSETRVGPPYAACSCALGTGALPMLSAMMAGVPSFSSRSSAASAHKF